jgi:hypothetical protein
VDRLPVDHRRELRERVEPGLGGGEVEAVAPPLGPLADGAHGDPVVRAGAGGLGEPAGAGEAVAQVGDFCLVEAHGERHDGGVAGRAARGALSGAGGAGHVLHGFPSRPDPRPA